MLSFLFVFTGSILPEQHLLGSPHWDAPVTLKSGRLIATLGSSSQPSIFQLEINGVLAPKTFSVLPSIPGRRVNLVFAINQNLNANDEIRIKCVSGPISGGLSQIGFNITAAERSTVSPPQSEFWVRFSQKSMKLRMFEYDPSTHLFTESSPGISSGLASIDNASTLVVRIFSQTILSCNLVGSLMAGEFICNGGTATNDNPRLEFYIDQERVASAALTGRVFLPEIAETASLASRDDSFQFFSNGSLAATLGPNLDSAGNILTAIELREPIA